LIRFRRDGTVRHDLLRHRSTSSSCLLAETAIGKMQPYHGRRSYV
jgi:hypothetical protein